MLFHWHKLFYPFLVFYYFYLQFLFFLSIGWYCGAGVVGQIGCRSLSYGLALPTSFNSNNNKNVQIQDTKNFLPP